MYIERKRKGEVLSWLLSFRVYVSFFNNMHECYVQQLEVNDGTSPSFFFFVFRMWMTMMMLLMMMMMMAISLIHINWTFIDVTHTHISHVFFQLNLSEWVINAWKSNICVKLSSRYSWFPPWLITSLINVSVYHCIVVVFFFQKIHSPTSDWR